MPNSYAIWGPSGWSLALPFELVARAPFNGPLRLRLPQHDVIIGPELAQHLRVILEPEPSGASS